MDAALAALQARVGGRLVAGESVRRLHARDEGWHPEGLPDAVAFPESVAEISALVTLCAAHRLPVIPFGAGSGMEGGVTAPGGGLSLDLSRMDRILAVHAEDMDCRVEAGVRRLALNTHLRDTGLFFPVDPGADATLGGMAATRASGPNAMRYGTMRDQVLALEAVLGTGEVIRTGSRARKSAAGFDLARLLIGSEGTLGIITSLCLRLQPIPEASRTALLQGASVRALVDYAVSLLQSGLTPAKLELMDETAVAASKLHDPDLAIADGPALLVEFAGAPGAILAESVTATESATAAGLGEPVWVSDPDARSALWKARHGVAYAERLLRPGSRALVTDVCVPISRLADCIEGARDDARRSGLGGPIVGHLGDGNFHVSLLIDPADAGEVARAKAVHARLVERALALEGTSTGEHGIGLGKRDYLEEEAGATGIAAMRAIKRALDPAGVLNPGKVLHPA